MWIICTRKDQENGDETVEIEKASLRFFLEESEEVLFKVV